MGQGGRWTETPARGRSRLLKRYDEAGRPVYKIVDAGVDVGVGVAQMLSVRTAEGRRVLRDALLAPIAFPAATSGPTVTGTLPEFNAQDLRSALLGEADQIEIGGESFGPGRLYAEPIRARARELTRGGIFSKEYLGLCEANVVGPGREGPRYLADFVPMVLAAKHQEFRTAGDELRRLALFAAERLKGPCWVDPIEDVNAAAGERDALKRAAGLLGIDQYEEAEMVSAKVAASYPAFIRQQRDAIAQGLGVAWSDHVRNAAPDCTCGPCKARRS